MRRGYCTGGPLHGQMQTVLHGAAFVHGLTRARYGWVESEWVYMPCGHTSYTQDRVTGECNCDDCGKMLIDSLGRVLE